MPFNSYLLFISSSMSFFYTDGSVEAMYEQLQQISNYTCDVVASSIKKCTTGVVVDTRFQLSWG